jgi:uncharacterized protein (TIGR00375 family)
MKIVADFHLHSKFSRATARDLDLESIYTASRIKGVGVVATGDFCHPGWFEEIEAKLAAEESGLLALKRDIAAACDRSVPAACRGTVRFILSAEISNIYKKDGRTRKNHNLVLLPDLDSARRFNARLAAIGNIRSDGRPILGLDARDLLEVVLETSPRGMLIPAHIWTPWFSMLGSKSGFDSIEECFGDLAPFVFAAETGLSSDPGMNRRVAFLDRISLVSNSDAHSAANIGREANLFDTERSYDALRAALEKPDPQAFRGTIEFFPEEGKYHLDGHRECRVRLEPRETRAHGDQCPVCAKPLTVGVLSRVEALADRPAGWRNATAPPYYSLIPLADILGEIFQTGAKSRKVIQAYRQAVEALGPELEILREIPPEDLGRCRIPMLREAIERMRRGEILIEPGFDGEYGKIRIFSPEERARIAGQQALFALGGGAAAGKPSKARAPDMPPAASGPDSPEAAAPADPVLNREQREAVEHPVGPLLIVAGPGTGKTRTLTCRMVELMRRPGVSPESILALTFTHRAAAEMQTRLAAMTGGTSAGPLVTTFHGLCWALLRDSGALGARTVLDEERQRELVAQAAGAAAPALKPRALHARILRLKAALVGPDADPAEGPPVDDHLRAVYRAYQRRLASEGAFDFEDLIFETVKRLAADSEFRGRCHARFKHFFVDEFQDINAGQYRLLRALIPPGAEPPSLCVIGDPDQSIYGFRGSDATHFERFISDFPGAAVVRLTQNYRSTATILSASFQVISRAAGERARIQARAAGGLQIGMLTYASGQAEAVGIARRIEELVGGTGYHAIDSGRVARCDGAGAFGYGEVAVLARTHAVLGRIAERFEKEGIPCQAASRRQVLDHPGVAALLALCRVVAGMGTHADLCRTVPAIAPGVSSGALEAFKSLCFQKRLTPAEGLAFAARFPLGAWPRRQQQRLHAFSRRVAALALELAPLSNRAKLLRLAREPHLSGRFDDEASRRVLDRLLDLAAEVAREEDFNTFLARVALLIDSEFYHPRAQKVALLSMHAAKGLEFPVVFIAGCEQGLIPYRRPDGEAADVDEERRLFYVAMTRARERLFLTRAARRRLYGRSAEAAPSPFLEAIARELIAPEGSRSPAARRRSAQLPLF